MDDAEQTFNGLRMTLEQMNRELAEEENTGQIGNIGALFSPRSRGVSGRPQRNHRRGNHPSRIFVFLGSRNPSDVVTNDCPSKKVKFPSSYTHEELMVLLRREFTAMGTSPRTVFYKSSSTGSHALHRIGENLDAKMIVTHFKYATTKVYIGVQSTPQPTATITHDHTSTTDTPMVRPAPTLTSTPTNTVSESSSSSVATFTVSTAASALSAFSANPTVSAPVASGVTPAVPHITLTDSDDDLMINAFSSPQRSQHSDDEEPVGEVFQPRNQPGNQRSSFSTGRYGPMFLSPGEQMGTIREDCSDRGLYCQGLLFSEQLKCIALARIVIGYGGPMLLSHNFNSLCHLIHYSLQPAVIILLSDCNRLTALEEQLLRNLSQWHVQKKDNRILFWISAKNLEDGRQALNVFRGHTFQFPQMLVSTASLRLQSTPSLVERFSGSNICIEDMDLSIRSAWQAIDVLQVRRINYENECALKKEQDDALKDLSTKKNRKDQTSQTEDESKENSSQQAPISEKMKFQSTRKGLLND